MKNLKKLYVLLIALVLVIPFGVLAKKEDNKETEEKEETKKVSAPLYSEYYKDYKTKNYLETLDDEQLEYEFENYEENDNQITVYMFRGKGCGFCRKFLSFLNSITDEYGKYFRLVSFEVWNDPDNKALMDDVSNYMKEEAGGVPYIIIGDKVFGGYASDYDEQIKTAIINLYNTKAEKRYDVFHEMNNKKNYDVFVAIGAIVIIGGIVALTVVTRKNNK